MKKTGYWFIAIGAIIMIIGALIWPNLSHVNIVDSNTWTVNINGYKSFRWPVFVGGIILTLGAMIAFTADVPKGHRVN